MRELWRCFLLLYGALGEDSCPAGDEGIPCRAAEGEDIPKHHLPVIRTSSPTFQPTAPATTPQVDLIAQEMDELKTLLKLGEERMNFPKELQGAASDGKGLPLTAAQVQALTERLPLLSEVASQGEREPIAAAEDFLVTKAALPLIEPVVHVEWLVLRNPRPSTSSSSASSTSQSQTPTCILAAAQADGKIHLFSPSGELVFSFNTGHEQPITHMATSPTHEEHLIATGDSGGAIRLHRVSVRQRRVSKEEKAARSNSSDKISQYLGPQLNVTVQMHKQFQLPARDDLPTLTALAIANHKSSREIVAGDSTGRISVFAKNGTLKGHVDATAMEGPGVEGLHSYHSQVLFRAGIEWGYVSLDKVGGVDVKHIDCPNFEGRVADMAVDTQQLSKVMLSDERGAVWVFNVKNRKDCELEKKFPYAAEMKAPVELAAIRGFVLGLQKHPSDPADSFSSILALNMSQHVGRRRPGETGAGGHVIWRRQRTAVRDWAVQRKQHGDLIALLSADGKEVEILEVLMQVYTPPPASDPFSNFKLPVMACAVLLLLGYQFMKQKKGGSAGLGGMGNRGKFGKSDFASLLNKKKMGGMGGMGGLGGLKGKR